MNRYAKALSGVTGSLVVLAGVGWLGLQVPPSNLPLPVDDAKILGNVQVPTDLPAPVLRYFETAVGAQAPRVESVVICGRARARFGLWVPMRYRLIHRPGYAFERYMEITWFGWPVLRAIDRLVEGSGMTGPLGQEATGPAIDQGANMILWAEAPLMPSLWITDERIRWQEIDDTAARLVFPFDDEDDELTVHFDEESGLITHITAQRYRDHVSGKIPWQVDFLTWQTVNGIKLPAQIAVTWQDQGEPWSYWDLEEVFWNVEIPELSVPRSLTGMAEAARSVAEESLP